MFPDRTTHNLREERWNRIPELLLGGPAPADNVDVVRERLQPAELTDTEASIRPVERSDRRTGLRLDRP